MNVYIPFCMAMLDYLGISHQSNFTRERVMQIVDYHRAWVQFDIESQIWTYFEVDANHQNHYTWHLGRFEDFTALLLINDSHARYTYAQAHCKTGKVIHGEPQYEN